MDLTIKGNPAELEWLRQEIERTLGSEAELEAVASQDTIELKEPLLIGLVVALGGPAIVEAIRDVLKRRYAHLAEMEALGVKLRESQMKHEYAMTELRLSVAGEDGEKREISEEELEGLVADAA